MRTAAIKVVVKAAGNEMKVKNGDIWAVKSALELEGLILAELEANYPEGAEKP